MTVVNLERKDSLVNQKKREYCHGPISTHSQKQHAGKLV